MYTIGHDAFRFDATVARLGEPPVPTRYSLERDVDVAFSYFCDYWPKVIGVDTETTSPTRGRRVYSALTKPIWWVVNVLEGRSGLLRS